MVAEPAGPAIGIDSSAVPAETPLATDVLNWPLTRNPSWIGCPRAARTAGLALARATASVYGSDDLRAPKTNVTSRARPPAHRRMGVRQPTGTTQTQFRPHQLRYGAGSMRG